MFCCMRLTLDFSPLAASLRTAEGTNARGRGDLSQQSPRNTLPRQARILPRLRPAAPSSDVDSEHVLLRASFLQFWLLALEIVFMLLIVLKLFRELRWLCRNGLIEWLASVRRRGRHAGSSPLSPRAHTAHLPLQVWHVADTLNCVILVVVYVLRLLVLMLTVREDFTWAPKLISTPTSTRWATPSPDSELARPRRPLHLRQAHQVPAISPQVPPSPSFGPLCRQSDISSLPPFKWCMAHAHPHPHATCIRAGDATQSYTMAGCPESAVPATNTLSSQVSFITRTLMLTRTLLAGHMVTIIIFFIAHMLALYHAFGGTLRTFSTPFDALNTMFSLVLGEFDPREIEEANPDVGKTIFLLFMFFFFFLLCAASSPARAPACAPSNEPIPPSFADPGTT